ncbi:heterocyst-inhibiting protein PatX [Microcoleus sp. B3-D7]|uniref:heterocyst-inhibiting protein PatX n=1 Tax=Microcoleus sp. B3-D7 TaxID=2818659 RepID=UPI002FD665D0
MQTYTAIALLSLLSLTLSANAAQAFETQLPKSDTASAEEMLSTQTQQSHSRRPSRAPNRGDGRR